MSVTEARAALRKMGRKVAKQKNGRYWVQGVWPDVRECDLEACLRGLEAKK